MCTELPFCEEDLAPVRESLSYISDRRRNHIFEVEKMAARIGAVMLPGKRNELILRAAGLLHDITKEYKKDAQVQILADHGITPMDVELEAPKCLHSITAAALIPERYPGFAIPEILSAVRCHTTGKADMNLYEKIIYLADYIDESRQFAECIALRNMFWDFDFEAADENAKLIHLDEVLVACFNTTFEELTEAGKPIHPNTNDGRNFLLREINALKATKE